MQNLQRRMAEPPDLGEATRGEELRASFSRAVTLALYSWLLIAAPEAND
jgi:hypothetical protein